MIVQELVKCYGHSFMCIYEELTIRARLVLLPSCSTKTKGKKEERVKEETVVVVVVAVAWIQA
jgi:hypothetical protein